MATQSRPEKISEVIGRIDGIDRRHVPRDHSVSKQDEIDWFIALANEARREYEDSRREYRELAFRESELEAERPCVHAEVKQMLMSDSPSLAATPAEKLATCHPTYLAHLAQQRETVRLKDDAATRRDSANLRAETSIAALRALAGLI